ncbi:MAG TPA: nitrilase-related carbon-nitrogen hydrolase, partial [Methylomirabilota bacterium]|nr:nitrilase-related carbon-nitrogen hydrolase [Methylomirabilota bacterium]
MKLALAQINPIVGDLTGNEQKIRTAYRRGVEAGVDLVLVPELAVCGYPPRDLLLQRRFVEENLAVVERL